MLNRHEQSVKVNFGKAPIFTGISGACKSFNNAELLRIQRNVTLNEPSGQQRRGESDRGDE